MSEVQSVRNVLHRASPRLRLILFTFHSTDSLHVHMSVDAPLFPSPFLPDLHHDTMQSFDRRSLAHSDADSSTTHSSATAPNLVGPGRTIGLLFDWLGQGLQSFLNKRAVQLNFGPEAVARDIRRLRRHEQISLMVRFAAPYAHINKAQEKKLRSLCKSLLKYAGSPVRSTQMKALEEIKTLAIEDPIVCDFLSACNLQHLVPKYREPDLIMATSRAVGCIENAKVHELWRHTLLLTYNIDDIFHNGIYQLALSDINVEALKGSLRNGNASFTAARYLTKLIRISNPVIHVLLARPLWDSYMKTVASFPATIEWSNVNEEISSSHWPHSQIPIWL
ncbi:hypothetical protein SCHPADRAFT_896911 [Schizopora paradoxa]|uniref:Uncharacterized protein n=1 Tax=Schizopora paradoxa TaxID=27342 RepID=A0A0H2QYF3_9AGAM|nr:hypothetical protein SCHPADRAFT_896911 [Schizopora paradoxa]